MWGLICSSSGLDFFSAAATDNPLGLKLGRVPWHRSQELIDLRYNA
jgi:hypothetical protein